MPVSIRRETVTEAGIPCSMSPSMPVTLNMTIVTELV